MARDLGNGIEITEEWSEDSLGLFSAGSQGGAPVRVRLVSTGTAGLRRLRRERSVLIGLSSRYVLPWRDVVAVQVADEAAPEVAFVSEVTSGPTLAQELDNGLMLDAAQAARLGADLALGLVALHAAGLVHGAIDTDLVRRDGEPSRGQTLPSARLAGVGVRSLAVGVAPTEAADLAGLAGVVRAVLGDLEPVDDQLDALLAELADESSGRTARDAATRLATFSNRLSTAALRSAPFAPPAPVAPEPLVVPEPEPEPLVAPEPEPSVEPEPAPVSEPDPTPEPVTEAAEPFVAAEPTPAAVPELPHITEPEPAPEPETAPEPEREPAAETTELPALGAADGWFLGFDPDIDSADPVVEETPAATETVRPPIAVAPPLAEPQTQRSPAEMLPSEPRGRGRRLGIIAVVIVVIAALIAVILTAGHSSGGGSKAVGQPTVGATPSTEASPVLTVNLSGQTIAASQIGRAARPLDEDVSSLTFNSLLMALYAYCDYYTPAASTETGHSFVGYSSGVGINIYEDVATYTGTSAKDLIVGVEHSLAQCPVLMAKDDAGNVLGTFRVSAAGPLADLPASQVGLLYERTDMIEPAVQAVFIQQGDYVIVVLAQGRNSADLGGPLDRAAIKALAKIPKR